MSDLTTKVLDGLIRALKDPPHARVGILAGKSQMSRPVSSTMGPLTKKQSSKTASRQAPTNAEIGAAHEYGAPSRGLPVRSFLRMPINDQLENELKRDKATVRRDFMKSVRDGTLIQFLKKLGIAGEAVCRRAFTNNGYGKWQELKPASVERKVLEDNILVDTQQLSESIMSQVKR